MYRVAVIPSVLYGTEAWVLYRRQIKLLERFHQRCLQTIPGIKWQDYISIADVLTRAHLANIESISLQLHLRWTGHVARMEDTRTLKAVLFGELKLENATVELQGSDT